MDTEALYVSQGLHEWLLFLLNIHPSTLNVNQPAPKTFCPKRDSHNPREVESIASPAITMDVMVL